MALVDMDAGPGLAMAYCRLMLAERDHARAKDRAIARQNEIAFQLPVFRHVSIPITPFVCA